MNIDAIRVELRAWIGAQSPVGQMEFGDSDDLIESGILDSLAAMMLLIEIERMLGRSLAEEDIALSSFRSINAIVDGYFDLETERLSA